MRADDVRQDVAKVFKSLAQTLDSLNDVLERDAGLSPEQAAVIEQLLDREREKLYVRLTWRYEHSRTDSRKIENQYPTMALDEIKELAVPASDDCLHVCFVQLFGIGGVYPVVPWFNHVRREDRVTLFSNRPKII